MPLNSCSRCGTETPTDGLLCHGCTGWLREQKTLDEAAVVDAMEFSSTPVPNESPVQIAFAAPALPLFLELLIALLLVIVFFGDPHFFEANKPSERMPFYIYVVSIFMTFGNVALGAYYARLRPLRAAIISASVCVGLTALPGLMVLAFSSSNFLHEVSGFFVLRIAGIVLFVVPLGFALRRQRSVASARASLLAHGASALEAPTAPTTVETASE